MARTWWSLCAAPPANRNSKSAPAKAAPPASVLMMARNSSSPRPAVAVATPEPWPETTAAQCFQPPALWSMQPLPDHQQCSKILLCGHCGTSAPSLGGHDAVATACCPKNNDIMRSPRCSWHCSRSDDVLGPEGSDGGGLSEPVPKEMACRWIRQGCIISLKALMSQYQAKPLSSPEAACPSTPADPHLHVAWSTRRRHFLNAAPVLTVVIHAPQ